jgi:hypothetical protein
MDKQKAQPEDERPFWEAFPVVFYDLFLCRHSQKNTNDLIFVKEVL